MEKIKSDFVAYLEQSEKNELEYNGIEADVIGSGDGDMELDEPYDIQNIRIERKVVTVYQIEHWISATSGTRLNLSPGYERKKVWDEQRKSALIESLLLRIPIPTFYLYEDGEGNRHVIDGMQRLTTIHAFLNNEFLLKGLRYFPECEKKYFRDLDSKFRGRIEDTELVVNILDERTPQMVKFDVFRRVNTGGLPLNCQEIRNAMALPKVRTLLRNMVECKEFKQATKGGVRDVRMDAQELCLRYLTILYAYDWKKHDFNRYQGLLKMMDQMVLILNGKTESKLKEIFEDFRLVMERCHWILGEYSFCKLDNNKINKSLFTAWAIVLANEGDSRRITNLNVIKMRNSYVERLMNDIEFYNAITSSTGTRKHIRISIEVIRNLWEECL